MLPICYLYITKQGYPRPEFIYDLQSKILKFNQRILNKNYVGVFILQM